MKTFEYRKVSTLEEAFRLFQEHGEGAKVLAGGTDLFVKMRNRSFQPEILIDLKGLPGLDRIVYDPPGGLRLGALVSIHDLETSPLVGEKFGLLSQGAASLGSYQIRCRATLGGNICNASPAADMVPGLVALGAGVKIVGPGGERVLPLEEVFAGPGKTRLQAGEILTEVRVPPPSDPTGFHYSKHGIRKAMDLAVVGVAVVLTADSSKERCRRGKIALGAVGPVPMRAGRAEDFLRGRKLDEEVISGAARLAAEEAQPVTDVRASAEYRREMVRVLTARAIRQAWQRIQTGERGR